MDRIKNRILNSKPVIFLEDFSKRIILPGFDNLPLYDVIRFFWIAIHKGALTTRASSLAFNFFLAIFPGIIFMFTLIPYIPIDNLNQEIFNVLREILPHNAFQATKDTVEDILQRQRGGLLSLGFILAMFFATNGVLAMIKAFNSSFYSVETRKPLMMRLVALSLVIILTFLLLIAVGSIVFSSILMTTLVSKGYLEADIIFYLIEIGRWIITLALLFFGFSFIYYLGPSKKKEYRFISAGSTLATMLTILTSLGFAFYVNNWGQYNKLYGSIGTLMVIMIWIYLNSLVLLIGFELNASILNARKALYNPEEEL